MCSKFKGNGFVFEITSRFGNSGINADPTVVSLGKTYLFHWLEVEKRNEITDIGFVPTRNFVNRKHCRSMKTTILSF